MADIFFERQPDTLKTRLLWPFSSRYRSRYNLLKLPEPLRLIAIEVLLTDDHKIALVKNSKAGCTTAAHILYQYSKGKSFRGDVHRPDIDVIQGEQHFPVAVAALNKPETLNITTIRHPVDRAVSAFTDFFLMKKNLRTEQHIGAMRQFGFDEAQSEAKNFDVFLDYVDHCFSVNRSYTDRHFRPQVINLAFGHISYAKICRVEQFEADMLDVLKQAGLSADQLSAYNLAARNSSRPKRFVPTKEHVKRLTNLYADDFENLGYDPDMR